ncbi:MAG: twin-arginine translocase TatA/TatE family subunit [Candidatus Omnitrophica bacterium CG11_big_fil_rev_8_21_14_0_20_63_9]|nr:MAG: twin-arginine translocase TatA/TatE family subunit [Candidatus Omnitrophica bacterium CG11_big_fil_rev_8_21_14_0_20_63_9]
MRLGLPELLIIFAIILLIVGARRLPDIGRALGRSIREFQRGMRGDDDEPPQKKEHP